MLLPTTSIQKIIQRVGWKNENTSVRNKDLWPKIFEEAYTRLINLKFNPKNYTKTFEQVDGATYINNQRVTVVETNGNKNRMMVEKIMITLRKIPTKLKKEQNLQKGIDSEEKKLENNW